MSKSVDLGFAFTLPPKEAMDYFKSLGFKLSDNALESYEAIKQRAFTVAGIARKDLLQETKAGLFKALRDGTTFEDFKSHIDAVLVRKGWQMSGRLVADSDGEVVAKNLAPYRLKTIFRTNIQSAYMAGRYKQMQADTEFAPYWQYLAVMDGRTRPSHRVAHGLVFRHDDSFWDSHYPPCDFNCRCSVRSLTERDVKRFGLFLSNSDGMLEDVQQPIGKMGMQKTVTAFKRPNSDIAFIPRAGFGRRPHFKESSALATKIVDGDPQIVAAAVRQLPALQSTINQEYQAWAREILKNQGRNDGDFRVVGTLSLVLQQHLKVENMPFTSAAILLRDKELWHLVRDYKAGRGAVIDEEVALNLPAYLASPLAVFIDTEDKAVIYVLDTKDAKASKLVVRTEYTSDIKTKDGVVSHTENYIRTAGRVEIKRLTTDKRYKLVEGEL